MLINNSTTIVYLVDDEFAIRDSLSMLIESTGQRVKSYETAEAFLDDYDPNWPGCLILDVQMPLISGLELQEILLKRAINIPIIFISGNAEVADTVRAFRAGAVDFLEKPFKHAVLLERIEEALQNDLNYRAHVLEKIDLQERINALTRREKEVLALIISNHSNKETAKILEISSRTIDLHRSRIMRKMQAENFTDLIMMVRQLELEGRGILLLEEVASPNSGSHLF